VIVGDFLKALAQLGDRRFRRVLWIGLGLTLALLVAVYAAFLGVIEWLTPEALVLPWVGEVGGLDTLLSVASGVVMLAASVFLMVPVASAFTGLYLEEVADAVEARHYPHLPPAPHLPLWEALVDSVNFFALLVFVNVIALAFYAFAGPLIPVVFWAVNGLLLGREYFMLAAMRRLGRKQAKALLRRNRLRVWVAGTLMAAPLSVPVVNLLVPVLGAATFTHLYHRLASPRAGPSG